MNKAKEKELIENFSDRMFNLYAERDLYSRGKIIDLAIKYLEEEIKKL